MDGKLRVCPFCGGNARIRDYKDVEFLVHNADCYMVQCDSCGCGTSYEPTEMDAIAAWTRRADEDRSGKRISVSLPDQRANEIADLIRQQETTINELEALKRHVDGGYMCAMCHAEGSDGNGRS